MYPIEELKKVTVTIKRQDIPMDTNPTEEILNFSFSNDEKIAIHLRPSEGTKPLFDKRCVNRESTPSSTRRRSTSRISNIKVSSQSGDYQRYHHKSNGVKNVMNKLDHMFEEMKRRNLDDDKSVKNSFKRTRRESRRISRSPSHSERSRIDSRSPIAKRLRRDSKYSNDHEYGHSSRYNLEKEVRNKRKHRYPDSSHSSRSSGSDQSFSRYLSRELERDMSTFLNDSFLSNDSSSNYKSSRNSRKYSNEDESKYGRKSSRKGNDKHGHYDRDYYRQEMSYHDMKERYARYYTVMYAFNIIMDILRKDDLSYNNI